MTFWLPVSWSPPLVVVSVLIAWFASYVALDLARRIGNAAASSARWWWLGGSLALGTGIWSMHFIGMAAFSLQIPLGFDYLITLASYAAAVAVSGIALYLSARPHIDRLHFVGGGACMAAGICSMHYIGMHALQMDPAIVWDWLWVAASILIAFVASLAALRIFVWMRSLPRRRLVLWQTLAALVMGLAIAGMHYAGMAAAHFPLNSICRAAADISASGISLTVAGATLALLAATLLTSVLDTRRQLETTRLAASLQEANQALTRAAFEDPLTQLGSRLLLEERLKHAVEVVDRNGKRACVLFIDLDGFKPVNDSLGHKLGDEVLRIIAGRIKVTVRKPDTLARVGGDEFVVLMEQVEDRSRPSLLAERLIEAIRAPIRIAQQEVLLSASVGIAVYPDDSAAHRLVANADVAMYYAKQAGKGTFCYYSTDMEAGAARLLDLQRDLRRALANEEFILHYQPLVAGNHTHHLNAVEALIRWQDPHRGLLMPGAFIAEAERFGLISEIGEWVLDTACRQCAIWREQGMLIPVAVNVSALQFRSQGLVVLVESIMRRHGLPPHMLTLELTESVAMDDMTHTLLMVTRLRELGVKIAIDDFGTGHSSLAWLRQFMPHELKIDRSFVQDIEEDPSARAIVNAVIQLAHALDIEVVAEGVETPGQRDLLQAQGCESLQGYFFARPFAATELEGYLRSANPLPAPEGHG
ncbi:bifunctional diguanylate cyclase/phosphodiesterase [Silvimonas sp. JCM 19000]